jgi:hypothetical protein
MLNAVDKMEDLGHISWMPGGRSFMILDCNKFAKQTLPRFFVGIQYKSFIRQLNIYGFRRVKDRTSPKYGQYSHPMFVRGEPDLCLFMTRQKVKGTGVPRANKTNGCSNGSPILPPSPSVSSSSDFVASSSVITADAVPGKFFPAAAAAAPPEKWVTAYK